jgi:hypothetical protein
MIGQIKNSLRVVVQRALPTHYTPVVVASMGRSGSTLIHNAISEGLARVRFGHSSRLTNRLVADYAWDINATHFRPGVVYKTHALAEELPSWPEVKVVFLFGSAVDAAVSVLNTHKIKGDAWITSHFQHLRAEGEIDDLIDRDVLRFADQLEGWTSLSTHPVIALKYDELWENEAALSEFLGYQVTLPERKARSKKTIDPTLIERLRHTHDALEKRIAAMPGVVYAGSRSTKLSTIHR